MKKNKYKELSLNELKDELLKVRNILLNEKLKLKLNIPSHKISVLKKKEAIILTNYNNIIKHHK